MRGKERLRIGALAVGVITLLWGASMSAGASDVRLTEAIKSKNYETVRALIQAGADVNAPEGDGATTLHWAVRWDDAEAADLLLRAGAHVNAANDYGVTPLSLACINRNAPMITRLLGAGADTSAATLMGETALMTCTRTGSVDAVAALLDHDASSINAKEASRGQTALMWAVAQGYPGVVRILIEHGADVQARTQTRSLLVSLDGVLRSPNTGKVALGGFTPLLFAARQGSVESAGLLLDAGAAVNETAPDGASALVVASLSGHGELASFLLDRGADPDAAGAGYAALHAAVLHGDTHLVKTLLVYGAAPNIRTTKGTRVPRHTNWWVLPAFLSGGTPYLLAANWGMSLTPVAPTGSGSVSGGLPSHAPGARRALRDRARVPRVLGAAPLGAGVRVPRLRRDRGVAHRARAVDVRGLWTSGVGDRGHHFPGDPYSVVRLVPGDLVGGQPKKWCQRAWPTARAWLGQLPHGVDVAAQAATRDGAAWPGPGVGRRSRWTRPSWAGSRRAEAADTWGRRRWWSLRPRCGAGPSAVSGCSGWPMPQPTAC